MEKRITPERMQELLEGTFGKENIKVVNSLRYGVNRISFEIHSDSIGKIKMVEINPYVVGTVFFDGLWEFSMVTISDIININPIDIVEFTEEDFFIILKELYDELVKIFIARKGLNERVKRLKEDPTAEIREQRLKGLL